MKKRLISVTVGFAMLLFCVTGFFLILERQQDMDGSKAELLVAVNEVEQLANIGEVAGLTEKTAELKQTIRGLNGVSGEYGRLLILCGICLLFLLCVFTYVYFAILRPFDKLKGFAEKISQGDFDIELRYERSNYFGAFTWAFDSMRREITKARSCEKEAIENNKTVIATLSHDIKTPIASIRAYVEGLEANMDSTPQKRERYLSVIMKKCDEVSRLTNDLFLHSLADLEKLKITPKEMELCEFLKETVEEMGAEQNDIHFTEPAFALRVSADENRLVQILENLVNNARKYAKTNIDIFCMQDDNGVSIHIQDHGGGIPDEDMPFIFEKFYRGKNCGHEQGSGLGLYIVKYLTEQMQGTILLHNHEDGLEAVITLPVLLD